jgi:hypothetical protein
MTLPAIMMVDDVRTIGLISILEAATLATAAFALHAGTLQRLRRIFTPAAFLLLFIPCFWMLLQIMPTSSSWFMNAVWISAAQALGQPLRGAISMDVGATLLTLASYIAVIAAAFIVAITALDRERAESILFALTTIAALIAAGVIASDLGYPPISATELIAKRADAISIAAFGVILSCAVALHSYAHIHSRKVRQRKPVTAPTLSLSIALGALFICLIAIVVCADLVVLIITLFGASILIGAFAIRKWRLDLWGRAGLAAIGAIAIIAFFSTISMKKDADPTIALSTQGQAASVERMLTDAKIAGAGAGTFQALLPIYRDISQPASQETPTTAAAISIEMGRSFLWGSVVIALLSASVLFRRAMRRGRDYLYPSLGAACIITVLIMAFVNSNIIGQTASLMIGAICGLAFAQSKSGSKDFISELEEPAPLERTKAGQTSQRRLNLSTDTRMRSALVLFSAALLMQACWILLPEGLRRNGNRLAASQKSEVIAQSEQDNKIAQPPALNSGHLWSPPALPRADQLSTGEIMKLDSTNRTDQDILENLTQALHYAPHRGDIWLMFAAMADKYKWPNYQPSSLLKMSYYTAPNEIELLPLRLNVALHIQGATDDGELQDMIRQDIMIVLSRIPVLKPALVSAYKSASPQGKAFADRVILDIDPGYLPTVRTKYP